MPKSSMAAQLKATCEKTLARERGGGEDTKPNVDFGDAFALGVCVFVCVCVCVCVCVFEQILKIACNGKKCTN